jgi:hypothetical protein
MENEVQAEMSYQEYCEWFAAYGDPKQESDDSDFNAAYDDARERYS